MKESQNEDFLKPLKNRPGLMPRQEFKDELAKKLQRIVKKKRSFQFLKGPLLVGVAIVFVFLIFSNDILDQFGRESGNPTDTKQENPVAKSSTIKDIIKWNGQIYMKKEIISGDLIGMKLGEITKKSKQALKDGEATKVEAGTMVYTVGKSEDIAVKIENKWVMYQIEGLEEKYISENEALDIAKRMAPDQNISWVANFEKDPSKLHDELAAKTNPIWKVVGTFPLGNKDIFYIDAISGEILLSGEQEAPGSM